MKKILIFSMSILLLHSMLDAEVIEKSYYFKDFKIVEPGDYQTINFTNTLLTGKVGEPTLPYHSVALLLPPGEVVESIKIIGEDETKILGKFKLYPRQPARKYSTGKTREFVKNTEVYKTNAEYPVSMIGKPSTEFMNGYSFGISTFTPLKYNPVTGKVTFFKKVTVKINTKYHANTVLENLSSSYNVLKRIRRFAQNPEAISRYPQKERSLADYQMLIITPTRYENKYQELIDLYLVRGIKTGLITTSYIDSSIMGQDLQEKIRNYIIQEYQAHSIEYVFLGGDVEFIPYRGFYCTVESGGSLIVDEGIPSDLYYSALDGSWNDDGDELWGEIGEDDLLPEVAIARFTINNSMNLINMLNKTISYQNKPVLGELRKKLLAAEKLWNDPLTWGGDYMDLLIGYKDDNGYITDGIPEDHDIETLYDRDSRTWRSATLISKINEGHSFIHHDGHSNFTYTMRLNSSQITNSNFSMINGVDHNYIPVYPNGCNCGGFDHNDCIGEEMLKIKNFAVAFIGNSRYGWFVEGTTDGPATHLHREFVDALYGNRTSRIGAAHLESRIESAPWVNAPDQYEEGAFRWNFYACNVLGDPAMSIWTDEPISIQVDYIDSILINSLSLQLNVSTKKNPAEGLNCVLINDTTIHGVGVTDSSGSAEIYIDPPISEAGEVDLIISGYNCLPTSFPISIVTKVTGDNDLLPSRTELLCNYPNPFNVNTKISYNISNADSKNSITMNIFNIKGQFVRRLVNSKVKPGSHIVVWDGKDSSDKQVSSGIYFYKLKAEKKIITKKMLLLK